MDADINLRCGSLGKLPVLRTMLRDALNAVDPHSLLTYEAAAGLPALRRAVAHLHGAAEENVLITSSGQQALQLILADRKSIMMQQPAYFGAIRLGKQKKSICFHTLDELKEKLQETNHPVIYLTSNFHNPTGETLTSQEKRAIAQEVVRRNGLVIEDNPYDQIYFTDKKPDTIYQYAPTHTIYISSFSKMLAPGLRVGYMLATPAHIERIKTQKITNDLFTSTLSQHICLYAMQRPAYLTQARKEYRKRRDHALAALNYYFKNKRSISWAIPKGGIFIQLQTPMMKEFVRAAQDNHVIMDDDRYWYCDGKSRNRTRLNFVQHDRTVLSEAIRRLSVAYDKCLETR
ncbi:PLP-dependent aminotransferase family protein [Candidatus Woesearchaeota archaeon]|nr:PLP-dependent aminotransferase family protein [Candidatus Woesearchaeota archaeon]